MFERVDPQELSEVLRDWLGNWRKEGKIVRVDGKTIRGSGNSQHKAYHVVSAFVSENHITLGELKTEEKSNEITAVPELLDILEIQNCVVTADAMSCQKAIARKIREKGADYVRSVKENQPSMVESIRDDFVAFARDCFKKQTAEKDHGRIEKQEYFLETELSWLEERTGLGWSAWDKRDSFTGRGNGGSCTQKRAISLLRWQMLVRLPVLYAGIGGSRTAFIGALMLRLERMHLAQERTIHR